MRRFGPDEEGFDAHVDELFGESVTFSMAHLGGVCGDALEVMWV